MEEPGQEDVLLSGDGPPQDALSILRGAWSPAHNHSLAPGDTGLSEPWAAGSRWWEVRVFASWRGPDSVPQTDLNQQACEVPVSAGLAPEAEVTAPCLSQLPGVCCCLCHFSACECITCPISASIFMGPPAGRHASFSSRGHLSLDLGPLIYPG